MSLVQWIAHGLRELFVPQPSKIPKGVLKVVNATRSTVMATRLEVASSGETRRKGLLGRDHLSSGEGLWIIPCESVHTFFMRFPIDLVYLDRRNRVKKVRSSVGAWRISACISAHSVLELPSGTVRATATERGDTIEMTSASVDGDECQPAG
jgi:uncharacterized protein